MFKIVSKIEWNKKEVDMNKKYDLFFKDGTVIKGGKFVIDEYDGIVCFTNPVMHAFYDDIVSLEDYEVIELLLNVKESEPSE